MDTRLGRRDSGPVGSTDEYRKLYKKTHDAELQKASMKRCERNSELIEEQRKAVRQILEEQKAAIRQGGRGRKESHLGES